MYNYRTDNKTGVSWLIQVSQIFKFSCRNYQKHKMHRQPEGKDKVRSTL